MIIVLLALLFLFVISIIYLSRVGARKEHFSKAALETFVVYLISNLPVLFLAWGSLHTSKWSGLESLENNLREVVNGGDIFIYVSAIVAPVVWALIAHFKDAHRVLIGVYFLALLIIMPFSAFSFQQVRLLDEVNQYALDVSAIILYIIALILWYGAVVYTKFIENYEPSREKNKVLKELEGGQ